MSFIDLIKNFFTHKDFLPPASEIPGTLFTPLHIVVSIIAFVIVVASAILLSKIDKKRMKITLTVLWAVVLVLEIIKLFWEMLAGREVGLFIQGDLPLYPCSIFLFIFPLALWGKDLVKHAVGSYVCTLGTLGALVNFVYPVNVIGTYSCISFAGCLTLFNHGVMLLSAAVLLLTHEHSFTGIDSARKLLVAPIPTLLFSIPVNIFNFTFGADYMFFKLDSFFLGDIFRDVPDGWAVVIMYLFYIALQTIPYLPSYISNKIKKA